MFTVEVAEGVEGAAADGGKADEYTIGVDLLDREFADKNAPGGAVELDMAAGGEAEWVGDEIEFTVGA